MDGLADVFGILSSGAKEAGTTGGGETARAPLPAALVDASVAGRAFVQAFSEATGGETSYIPAIKGLTPALAAQGVEWLGQIVDSLCSRADALFPSLGLCAPGKR
jgi:hypothetical protein